MSLSRRRYEDNRAEPLSGDTECDSGIHFDISILPPVFHNVGGSVDNAVREMLGSDEGLVDYQI